MQGLFIQIIGVITVLGFLGMLIFQLFLAFGAPIAHLSWGGRYEGKLPKNLRIASFISSSIFIFGGLCVLERVGIFTFLNRPQVCRYTTLALAVLFALSTLGNLTSKSKAEKKIMAPISISLSIFCFIIALAGN